MGKKIIYSLLLLLIFSACKQNKNDNDYSKEFEIPDSVIYKGELEISEQAMNDIIQNISSPVEMAALLKSLGIPFSQDYLATTDNVDNYNTKFKKAISLGIFGADLGYLNMYNKTSSVINYISAIKKLADGIHVGQFFDFTTLKRLATNNQNLDSLMYISVYSFNQMDRYLRENKRSNLSSLIVAGVWIEGLYLAGEVAKEAPTPKLKEKIGEQKIILSNLMLILKNYERDPKFKTLVKDLEEIQNLYKDVVITYERGEPKSIEVNGTLMIEQTDKSIVQISDMQMYKIIDKINEIRNKIINL
ncbi:MAG: hypothetical protein U9R54_10145 [Bacteroidota bacterium]|nr:hypothetical protein [Bacteroidota bacterium]